MIIPKAKKGQMLLLVGQVDTFAYIKVDDVSEVIIAEEPYDYSISVPYDLRFKTLNDVKQLIINTFYEKG